MVALAELRVDLVDLPGQIETLEMERAGEMACRYANCACASIHLNFVTQTASRILQIVTHSFVSTALATQTL